jgi:hypothetical protein
MITVQWAEQDELAFTGQEYHDDEYSAALREFERRKGDFDRVRIILVDGVSQGDWVVLHEIHWEDT